jgi:hypothetical protein
VRFGETVAVVVVLQKTELRVPQVPEKTWKRPLATVPMVMTGLTVCAVKLYHTSGLVALQAPIETLVELVKVPVVGLQD